MRLIYSFSILLLLFSCSNEPEGTPFNNYGISFSIPDGWKELSTPIENIGMYIMVEKQGDDESGQFITSILNNKIPLNTYMDLVKGELVDNLALQNTKIQFTEVKESEFNGFDALNCSFQYQNAGLDFKGELKAFYCEEKTIYILLQEAKEDVKKNSSGFKTLKQSFTCG